MEINGLLFEILPAQTGVSAKGEWKKEFFVIETQDQFPKKLCFSIWNGKISLTSFAKGDVLKVSFDAESREYNQRWYTDLKAWKVERIQDASTGVKSDNSAESEIPSTDLPWDKKEEDDLPF